MKKAIYQCILLVTLLLGLNLPALAKIEVEDVLGRHITLEAPAERIFLGFYFEDYLAIAGPDAYKKVAIFPRHSWKDYRQSQWQTYRDIIPEIETITDSGSIYTGTFDFESLLTTKPDVALLAAWQYDALGDKVALLEKSGIKVVVVDFNAQTLERHLKSARVIGKVMGTEGRAEAIAQDYEQTVNDVQRRVAKYLSQHPQRRVYVEIGTGGAAEYGKSYANAMWGNLLNVAGANNIANGKIDGSAHLTPEYVLSQDPEVIFISGAHWAKHNGSALLGFGTKAEDAQATYHPYLERAGWEHITAVKQGHVYGMYHSGTRTIYDHIFLEFLAKSIYPEAFKDVDPMAHHRAFFEQYMPQKLSGTFMIKVDS
ncbi:ABC transporter substrate-binding protein [Vibrio sp. OCN044]|uniref:ABC transporter substrate-binding protein n=1 Tax=Vibrio tetraodonis subsp. pristinus TaxID=2695891 RepID=A0A6L8M346_9VIBR|nr:ABC transporter substrate-binding protein [Vibrio tetraodonis]MYM60022.1 ABC transporter substrate-binding protein [Vibrio tetraodonis subsp. pristinus]